MTTKLHGALYQDQYTGIRSSRNQQMMSLLTAFASGFTQIVPNTPRENDFGK